MQFLILFLENRSSKPFCTDTRTLLMLWGARQLLNQLNGLRILKQTIILFLGKDCLGSYGMQNWCNRSHHILQLKE
uniref:Uncharacterized protein n=1 Tax=Salix viminalis TaxID=40686 RepID=A0A6N2MQY3_SALVM